MFRGPNLYTGQHVRAVGLGRHVGARLNVPVGAPVEGPVVLLAPRHAEQIHDVCVSAAGLHQHHHSPVHRGQVGIHPGPACFDPLYALEPRLERQHIPFGVPFSRPPELLLLIDQDRVVGQCTGTPLLVRRPRVSEVREELLPFGEQDQVEHVHVAVPVGPVREMEVGLNLVRSLARAEPGVAHPRKEHRF